MLRPRHAATAALGALAAGLLTACSGGPAATGIPSAPTSTPPATAPPGTPAATPTAAASATPTSVATADAPLPTFPDEGNFFEQNNAVAFAIYYIRVLNHDRATGDPSLLRSISDPGCSGCVHDMNEIDALRKDGYTSRGLEIQFRNAVVDYWNPEIQEAALTITTHRPLHETIDKSGKVVEKVPALEAGTFRIDLRWRGDRWIVWEVE